MTVKVATRESKLPVKVGMELAGSQAASGSSADVAVAVAASRAAWLMLKRGHEKKERGDKNQGGAEQRVYES